MKSWDDTNAGLRRLVHRQIFFVGGAPRSGTTWLQQIIDSHPNASCKGEGLFSKNLFPLIESLMSQRMKELQAKNQNLFQHTGGYPLPMADDGEFLAATVILLALQQQAEGKEYLAYGEKTPENVFYFARFRKYFPRAKFVTIARDPRDVLTSAWHFFRKPHFDQDNVMEKFAFIREALPSISQGAKVALDFARQNPEISHLVTYERLHHNPVQEIFKLFEFLGLAVDETIVTHCIEQTTFSKVTGGRPSGVAQNGSFMRKGIVGDWTSTLTPAMNDLILNELGWMFPSFGWTR